ncbi:MAG TPA: DUF1476 domain-containing protein [Stellaceae bacterium]|nr:DUF1476 domain-containing protein [Stellaceae bacterium]
MTTFDEREKGHERKFQHDQEMAFKVKARRNHLLGLWAAKHLGLAGSGAEAYARELVAAALQKRGDEAMAAKIESDFKAKGVALDAARIKLELEHSTAEAKKQLGVAS